jgi:NAD-specific glutamate dehydrogenase
MITSALGDADPNESPQVAIDNWLNKHQRFIRRWQSVLAEMQNGQTVDCAIFTVAINVLYELT